MARQVPLTADYLSAWFASDYAQSWNDPSHEYRPHRCLMSRALSDPMPVIVSIRPPLPASSPSMLPPAPAEAGPFGCRVWRYRTVPAKPPSPQVPAGVPTGSRRTCIIRSAHVSMPPSSLSSISVIAARWHCQNPLRVPRPPSLSVTPKARQLIISIVLSSIYFLIRRPGRRCPGFALPGSSGRLDGHRKITPQRRCYRENSAAAMLDPPLSASLILQQLPRLVQVKAAVLQ